MADYGNATKMKKGSNLIKSSLTALFYRFNVINHAVQPVRTYMIICL